MGELGPNMLVFMAAAGIAGLASVGVVAFNNAIRSALCLVVNFLVLAVLYFTLNAETIGITQIVVYTGAIMVLFLFVIMLLNLGASHLLEEKRDWKRPAGIALGFVMFALISSQLLPVTMKLTQPRSLEDFGSPQAMGRVLFTTYVFPFEAVSILLLIGIVGSIVLAKRRAN